MFFDIHVFGWKEKVGKREEGRVSERKGIQDISYLEWGTKHPIEVFQKSHPAVRLGVEEGCVS